MNRAGRETRPYTALLAAVVSGGLLALAFPPTGWGGLAWVALVPLIYVARRAEDARAAANLGAAASLVFFVIHLHWFAKIFGVTGAALIVVPGLFWAAALALTRRLQDRLPAWSPSPPTPAPWPTTTQPQTRPRLADKGCARAPPLCGDGH